MIASPLSLGTHFGHVGTQAFGGTNTGKEQGMKQFTRTLSVSILLGVAIMVSWAGAPTVAAEGKMAIEMRLKLMKGGVLKNFLYVKKFVKEGKGSAAGVAAGVAAHASLLNDASTQIVAHFPKGSGRGDFDEKTTRALPKIWENWRGFQAAAMRLTEESAKLARVAAGGDKNAIAKQFGQMGKLGCGGCHKMFRGAKVK